MVLFFGFYLLVFNRFFILMDLGRSVVFELSKNKHFSSWLAHRWSFRKSGWSQSKCVTRVFACSSVLLCLSVSQN